MPKIAQQLTKARKRMGISQEELAHAADVSVGTIQNAEYGRPVRESTVKNIADSLGIHFKELLGDNQNEDGLRSIATISSYLNDWIVPPGEAYCDHDSDIKGAASEMVDAYISEFQHRDSGDARWRDWEDTYRAIIQQADTIVDSYVRVWKVCESSFLFATQKGQRTGLSAIWPLSDWAYEEMRNGRLSFSDIDASHIQPDSQNLFINSARELNPPQKFSWGKVTGSVSHVSLYQMALMSQNSWADTFRILCIGGSPNNRERILSNGFVPLKNRMSEIPFPMFEISSTVDQIANNKRSSSATASSMRRFSISCAPDQIKRMSLRGVISAYQRILGKPGYA